MFARLKNKKKTVFALMGLSLLVAGCSNHSHLPKKQAIRLPFIFQVESFDDRREFENNRSLIDAVDTREKYSFNQDLFMNKLVRSINHRSLYKYDPARLRIRLKDYAAVKDSNLHSVSFYADLTGVDKDGKVLASGLYSCFASDRQALNVRGTFETFFSPDPQYGKKKDKDQVMWEKLYEYCLADMAHQFNEKVVHLYRGNS